MKEYKIKLNNEKLYVVKAEDSNQAILKLYTKINDMAMARQDAISRCISLGKKFIQHFDKIYKDPNNSAKNHWLLEMKAWYKSVKEIRLKPDSRLIFDGELRDWFFTAGALPDDFMKNPTPDELQKYDSFVTKLLNTNDLVNSINAQDKLIQSSSKKALSKNIAAEIKSGKDPKQADAIAYSVQRENDSNINDDRRLDRREEVMKVNHLQTLALKIGASQSTKEKYKKALEELKQKYPDFQMYEFLPQRMWPKD